jgi:hypothetical protein
MSPLGGMPKGTCLPAFLKSYEPVDEFDNLLHEFAAFQDYARSYRRGYRILARLAWIFHKI